MNALIILVLRVRTLVSAHKGCCLTINRWCCCRIWDTVKRDATESIELIVEAFTWVWMVLQVSRVLWWRRKMNKERRRVRRKGGWIKGESRHTGCIWSIEVQWKQRLDRHGYTDKLKKKDRTRWDNLAWGVPEYVLDMDMNGAVDQMVHQTIRIFGLGCDM